MKKLKDIRNEQAKYDYGTPESVKLMKKMTPGEKTEQLKPTTAQIRIGRALKKQGVGKNDEFYKSKMSPEKRKEMDDKKKRPAPMKVNKPTGSFKWFQTRDMKKDG